MNIRISANQLQNGAWVLYAGNEAYSCFPTAGFEKYEAAEAWMVKEVKRAMRATRDAPKVKNETAFVKLEKARA